jgi:glycosyltransferase involved in cell wall biosynthesis
MRIIAVQTGLSPHSVLGGTITDREVLTRLAARGVEVHVLSEEGEPVVEHPGFVNHFWRPKIRRSLRPVINAIPFAGNLDVARELRRLLQTVGPVDWIRYNSPYSVGLGTALAAGKHKVWGSYLHLEDRLSWKLIDRRLPCRCDLITCLCADTRADLIARCPRADHPRNIVLPLGIDLPQLETAGPSRVELRRSLDIPEEDVLVLFVGVLIARKGVADLVAAWRMLGEHTRARLVVIGRPLSPYESGLIRQLAAQDPRVCHIETVPYEQRGAYFRASDIFAFPTHLEGFGIVVGEAMACGLPVLTTRAKGVRSVVIENETALLTEIGQPKRFASQLGRLIDDQALRQQLGQAGKRHILTHFQWERIISSLLTQLQQTGGPHTQQPTSSAVLINS